MSRRNRKPKSVVSLELELDGFETASSPDDLSDAFDADEDDEDEFGNPLYNINITDEFSGFSLPDVQIEETEDPFKNTELVLKFSHKIHPEALTWFLDKVTAKKSHGGCELMLRREPYFGKKNEGLVVHVTAATWRQLEVAEMLEIKKTDYSQEPYVPRDFQIRELHKFLKDDMENHDILTSAEKQIVVLHELQHLHSLPGEKYVPGYNKYKLLVGQSIFHLFTTHHLITSYFPLHGEDDLNRLTGKWFWESFSEWPYEDIRDYFGDSVCLYFNFVAYYSLWLLFPTIVGALVELVQFLFPETLLNTTTGAKVIYCLINMFFLTLLLIYWQRFQSKITYNWGTLRMHHWEEPRASYTGTLALDPVTGKLQRRFPYIKTAMRTCCGSFPVIGILCLSSLWACYIYLIMEEKMKEYVRQSGNGTEAASFGFIMSRVLVIIPSTVYAICVVLANLLYRKLANWLTEWENHRTEAQFERHLVLKMVVFEVVNNFVLFFYTAFVLKDYALLKKRLLIFLIVVQLWMIIEQCVLPILIRKGQAGMHKFLRRHRHTIFHRSVSSESGRHRRARSYPGLDKLRQDIEVLEEDDPRVEMSKVEEHMLPSSHETDFDDYLNLFLQFGYVFFFSSVLPSAAFLAFSCNILLLWASLFKRREVYKRSIAKRVGGIGAWLQAFEFMAVMAVMTNCALIGSKLRPNFPSWSDWEWTVICFGAEHLILFGQYFVQKIFPKIPYKVKVALATLEYHSKEAFKREQARKTRRRMTHVFRPINESLLRLNRAAYARNGARSGAGNDNLRLRYRSNPGPSRN